MVSLYLWNLPRIKPKPFLVHLLFLSFKTAINPQKINRSLFFPTIPKLSLWKQSSSFLGCCVIRKDREAPLAPWDWPHTHGILVFQESGFFLPATLFGLIKVSWFLRLGTHWPVNSLLSLDSS
jgi:hypothetical protein